ncbi:hypothetical protein ACFBZI_05360 [Moraxella sp. ZJ142]|uniref:hypothetical protein n=1 Tax=Moraxella marmotae TaxID=3344520 RepID=UPI0035D4D1AA
MMSLMHQQQAQALWSNKTSFEELQTRQILIDEPLLPESNEEKITYVQRSQCRTTHKRKDC